MPHLGELNNRNTAKKNGYFLGHSNNLITLSLYWSTTIRAATSFSGQSSAFSLFSYLSILAATAAMDNTQGWAAPESHGAALLPCSQGVCPPVR